MVVDVKDKVILITGASRGIGRQMARAFAEEGASVVINYNVNEIQASELAEELERARLKCFVVKADICNPAEVNSMYRMVKEKYGRVDVLINNAGICSDNPIQLMQIDQWQDVIDVNLTGTFLCSRAFSKLMIHQGGGSIINISSLKGIEGCEGQVNYSASKAGVIGLTKALAKELGKYNIRVNAVCPGFIVTDLNRHNEEKKMIAKRRNVVDNSAALEEVVNFSIYLSSGKLDGASGRVFELDSRIRG
ncbi:MAG: SDR family oxidoreductase [Lachnospiraceae bacterium]|nr:SDR family oxidoreductase [Lachnospiraceae bacterium]